MKIDGQNGLSSSISINHSEPPSRQGAAVTSGEKGSSKTFDRIEISPQARQADKLKKALDDIPEVRLDKVALMKQQLNQGSYRIDPTHIAEKMMDSFRRN